MIPVLTKTRFIAMTAPVKVGNIDGVAVGGRVGDAVVGAGVGDGDGGEVGARVGGRVSRQFAVPPGANPNTLNLT